MSKNRNITNDIGLMALSLFAAYAFWMFFAFLLSDTVCIDAQRTRFDTVCDIVGWVGGAALTIIGVIVIPIHMLRKMICPPNQAAQVTARKLADPGR